MKSQLILEDLAWKNKWQWCKKCKIYIEKTEACNHMKCKCGWEFCYACGGDYPNCDCLPEHMRNQRDGMDLIR